MYLLIFKFIFFELVIVWDILVFCRLKFIVNDLGCNFGLLDDFKGIVFFKNVLLL